MTWRAASNICLTPSDGSSGGGGGEGKREFAKHVSLERRWRDAQFARCDLYHHTWSGGAG
jgi:hypothetical protein